MKKTNRNGLNVLGFVFLFLMCIIGMLNLMFWFNT